jgi:hypothetical protein
LYPQILIALAETRRLMTEMQEPENWHWMNSFVNECK